MKIVWSQTAETSFDDLVFYLGNKWGPAIITKLFVEMEIALKLISDNPYIFPVISPKKQIRKCVIRKRTILLYKINWKNQEIEIILVIDGRINPLKYKLD
jgi:plasmid stabilization system protein ParE